MSGSGDSPGNPEKPNSRLFDIRLDQSVAGRSSSNIDHEREVAIYDILDANTFALDGRDEGPYRLTVGIVEDRLVLTIGNEQAEIIVTHVLSLSPIRRLMKDYFIVCESYYAAIRSAPPSRIQSIDMGRRALHDEGSRLLLERLKGKITMDQDTARRMFTLICALHWKG